MPLEEDFALPAEAFFFFGVDLAVFALANKLELLEGKKGKEQKNRAKNKIEIKLTLALNFKYFSISIKFR